MYVEQIFTSCLAEMAYYIESNGEAVVIDPLRETTPYIEKANSRGAKIKYVFLTHFHADFVSGHVDLAKKTGATIVFGPNAKKMLHKYSTNTQQILPKYSPGYSTNASKTLQKLSWGKFGNIC